MSSITSTGLTITREELDNPTNITINTKNSKVILENTSSDVTISKYEEPTTRANSPPTTNTSVPLKSPRVLPLVYFKNSSKSFPMINNAKIPKFQIASLSSSPNKNKTIATTIASASVPTNQNVIYATGRPPPLVLQKPQGNMLPVVPVTIATTTKFSGVFTLKSTNSSTEPANINSVNTIQINASNIPQLHELPIINNNTFLQSQSTQQKLKKFIIAPMPKITTNQHLPTTITTNSITSKLSILPMPVPCTEQVLNRHKLYSNFKITDGQLQSNCSDITMMCNNLSNENSMDVDSNSENLVCEEIIDLDSPDKSDIANKSYELSIIEDSLSSHNEVRSSVIAPRPGKDLPKFPKHGVSILKKNYSFTDHKVEKINNPIVSNNSNSVSENKEIVITKPGSSESESVIITIPVPAKPEKVSRRKSNFSYRKEFDEMEVTSTSSLGTDSLPKSSFEVTKTKQNLTSEMEIELVEEQTPVLKTEDCDLQKVLKWEDGIGTLKGSRLKFIMNEFNLIEYITDDEYKTMTEKHISKVREKIKSELQEEVRCLECGCFGMRSDFISPKFCSFDCHQTNQVKVKKEKSEKMKKRKKKVKVEPEPVKVEKEEEISEEDSVDNNSQDKLTYPWACKKKGFSWSKYLDHVKAKPAPVKLFKDPFPYTRNGFKPGMKLEGVDPQHPSYFCVLTVAEVVGYRMRLHFDGYPDNYDFWCNADSMDVFPMGWCEKYGHVLQPPSGYKVDNFSWSAYLKATKGTAAPKHLFANRAGQAICPNGFRVGMKLEAVDRKNTALVCVASVRDMMDNRILVHFDSWDDIYDYWADPTSPYIHPVGWCDQYGHNLTPPNDYPNPESFSWESYLKERKAVAAPVRAFKQRPACGFKRSMRLECVDRRVPQLIRVATVDDVKEHQIRIKFDGWRDRYSYWVDDDSADVHPMGWCQKTGHPIEPPLTPEDVYDFLECPTVGCRGQGHIQGPKFSSHSTLKYCPYAEENIDLEKILPDRLLSPDKSPEAVVPVSREPKECKIKPKLGRPPKHPRPEQPPKPEPVEEDDEIEEQQDEIKEEEEDEEEREEPPEKKPKRKYKKRAKSVEIPDSPDRRKAISFIDESKILPVERESWPKHSEFLRKYIRSEADPRYWSNREVVNFVSRLPCCGKDGDVFRKEKIDGEAFLSLSQKDILSLLRLKVGPAVKLYNSIVLLRRHVEGKVFA
ncbi:unnamed protein product [Phaedon cochleariae]|uniref:SAM domain-containing protein n=1 Tax=Phaedon cochleariae TaxID=80249 RepID=A0A9P0DN56_PHACE|nr:unnamed protein product [Phaedon cochleariae]